MPSTVKVVVRCKPKEDPTTDHLTAVDLPDNPGNSAIVLQKGLSASDGLYQFNFTRVLDDKSQQEVYEVCGKGMVPAVLDGYNCTVMAYGQTGSGKTYTMTGPQGSLHDSERKGLVPRLIEDIFSEIVRRGLQAVVTCSYIEIYNEHFRDLLDVEGAEISVSEMGKRMILKGARQPQIGSAEEALQLLSQGEAVRHVAGHGMNTRSSRSHTIFTMLVSSATPTGKKLYSKLNLVDLAGSERANKTGVSGAAAREALYINKSLTFLEQVIVALAKKNVGHVPYRSSKLTHFLKDSLGGNCKTLLIANIWSSYNQINETISTCRFANRMMQVTEDAQSNNDGFHSVHGNLFKLDPVMQGYLETITAAAVAREKAKLVREFQRHGYIPGEIASPDNKLTEHEREELKRLRAKVMELEEMQEMTRMASEAARNGVVVDRETLEEMEMLRKRLLELEAENVIKSLDEPRILEDAQKIEMLEEELRSLREQVYQLKSSQHKDDQAEEVKRLRAQLREMQERELQRQASAGHDEEISEEELQELLELKELRDRAIELQKRRRASGSLDKQSLDDTYELENTIKRMGIMSSPQRLMDEREVEMLHGRIRQLEAANALSFLPSIVQSAHPLSAPSSLLQTAGSSNENGSNGSDPGDGHGDMPGWENEPRKKSTAMSKLRKGLSKVLKGGKTSRPSSARPPPVVVEDVQTNSETSSPRTTRSRFSDVDEETNVPNIVILNSLSHEQLLELVRGSPEFAGAIAAAHASAGRRPPSLDLKAIPVPSYDLHKHATSSANGPPREKRANGTH